MSYCQACADYQAQLSALTGERDTLRAENARLKEMIEGVNSAAGNVALQLRQENERLRSTLAQVIAEMRDSTFEIAHPSYRSMLQKWVNQLALLTREDGTEGTNKSTS